MTEEKMRRLSEQAMKDAYEEEKIIAEHNENLIQSLGKDAMEQFKYLTDDLAIHFKIEIVSSPKGRRQKEDDTEIFTEIHVDQTTNGGYSGDDFAGDIYAKTSVGWLKIPYSC